MDPLMLTVALGGLAALLLGLAGAIAVIRGMKAGRDSGPDPVHQRLRVLTEMQKLSNVGSVQFFLPSGRAVWSEEMYRIAGLAPGLDAPGFWTFPDIVHPDDREEVRRQLHLTAGGGGAFDTEFRLIRPDGSEKLVHGIARRDAVEESGEIRIIGAFVDISGYKSVTGDMAQSLAEAEAARAEAEAARAEAEAVRAEAEAARDEAEAANRSKSDFLAVMSHELRTPLNSILGFSEIIKDQLFGPIGTPRYADYAADIMESGEHLLGVINDILDLSKIEAGHMELNEEPVDLLTVMQDATNLVQERAAAKGILLKISLPHDLPMIRADGRLIRQMLINLLANAVEHTLKGGWIAVTAERGDKGGIAVAVADNGVGIAPEDLPRVVKPFHTKSEQISGKSRGTGLGLPLVKSLIERHGGEFHIESTPGTGTMVVLTFPASRVINDDGKDFKEAS